MKDYLLRYDEVIKIVKSSVHPIILFIVLYYTVATLTLWPVVVWFLIELMILLGIGFILIKDAILDKLLNRKEKYHTLSSTKNTVRDDEVEIDWTDFDITKYPRENYRKIFWEDRASVGVASGYNKYFLKGYPWGDISVVVCFCLSVFLVIFIFRKKNLLGEECGWQQGGFWQSFYFMSSLKVANCT